MISAVKEIDDRILQHLLMKSHSKGGVFEPAPFQLDQMDERSVLHYELGFYEKSGSNCYRGTLTFALRYDFIHRVLMLHVLRANHLSVEVS